MDDSNTTKRLGTSIPTALTFVAGGLVGIIGAVVLWNSGHGVFGVWVGAVAVSLLAISRRKSGIYECVHCRARFTNWHTRKGGIIFCPKCNAGYSFSKLDRMCMIERGKPQRVLNVNSEPASVRIPASQESRHAISCEKPSSRMLAIKESGSGTKSAPVQSASTDTERAAPLSVSTVPSDRELGPPPEWPEYCGPTGDFVEDVRFSLRLPRGWAETTIKTDSALFAAMSPDRETYMELFIGPFKEKGRHHEWLAELEQITLKGLGKTHLDVRELWRGNGGTLTGGACRRQIVSYAEKNSGIESTTDYFYLANAHIFISANFKTSAYGYRAGLFERITRGIRNSRLGPFTIFQRNPCPMAVRASAPAGWIPCHYDPFAFSYPPEWQEVSRDHAQFPGAIELVEPSGGRFMAGLCDSKLEGKSCEGLFYLADGIHGALNANEGDGRLVWQGVIPQSNQGRCIRVVYNVPQGVRPTIVRDIIILGNHERAIIFQLNMREATYKEIIPTFETIARTAVVGPLGQFTINPQQR